MRLGDLSGGFAGTDAALARLDALLSELSPNETDLQRRLRLDRLVALRDRVRMREAITEAEALRRDAPLPPYAEEAYADALLYSKQPGPAREAYRRVLAQNPKDVQAQYGVFYASIELEDFSTAYFTIDSLAAAEPVWRSYRDDPTRYANYQRADAELTAALARFYGSQLAEAWARVARLSDAAPAAPDVRIAASHISAARGWPRRATEEAEIGASLAPGRVAARIALAESAAANYRFDESSRLSADLTTQHPENPAVRRLARDLDAIRRWDLGFDAQPSDSEGGGANASGEAVTLHGRLTSPPIGNNWRFFVLSDYSNAHPPEGFTDRGRGGVGLEWRTRAVTATIVPSRSWGTVEKNSLGAAIDWRVTDRASFSIAAERFSWDTPLRALLQGITSDDYSGRATYRWHESRLATANVVYQPFSDGNRRLAGGAAYSERLMDLPAFDLTGTAEVYASRNTRAADAPYYNPARDLSASGGVRAEHTAWRRYDVSIVQAISADLGLYAQRGFDNDWIGTLTYEHRWRFDPLTSFTYGVRVSRRVYDGAAENAVALIAGLGRKF
jgi:biofilm PGA synthesis protein PgaA